MTQELTVTHPNAAITRADSDEKLITLWLATGRRHSQHTKRAYRRDVERFLNHAGRPLRAITLDDLVDFAASLSDLAASSRKRVLSAVKSLLTFGQKCGYLVVNVGAALTLPTSADHLAERILNEEAVLRMIALETDHRNHAVLRLLYAAGLRVSELCALTWRSLTPNGESGQVTVDGKGGKTRAVLLKCETWQEVLSLRAGGQPDDPVFRSRQGGRLTPSQVWRIVRKAAQRAGIDGVSPHWLRHSHASHALDRGAPISLVRETLGHADISTTGHYLHARRDDSSARYLAV